MGGILGVFNRGGKPVDPDSLARMVSGFPPKFSDRSFLWHKGSVGLGRVAATGAPHPLRYDDGLAVVFFGAIRNRSELIRRLDLSKRAELSDEDLILAAYYRDGQSCIDYLVGEFAFAIWNPRAATLLCVRDPFGICPFYYYRSENSFLFSSEIGPLLQCPQVSRTVNEHRIAELLTESFLDEEATAFNDVHRLPPGHVLEVQPGAWKIHRYWSPDRVQEVRYGSDDAYVEAFRTLFVEAVRCRLSEDGLTGVTLSGGLDSSSIACVAREVSPTNRVAAFSALYPGFEESDERKYIKAVVEGGGFETRVVYPSQHSTVAERQAEDFHVSEPLYWPTWCMEGALFRAAEDCGTSVLLTGHGGDHVLAKSFVGHRQDLIKSGHWRAAFREARAGATVWDARVWTRLWGDYVKPLLRSAAPDSLMSLKREYGGFSSRKLERLNPTFARQIGFEQILAQAADDRRRYERSRYSYHAHLLTHPPTGYGLDLVSVVSSRFPFQISHPFWDRRLVEFCHGIPREALVENGVTGTILRNALSGLLPRDIRRRTSKALFDPVVIRALRQHDADWLRDQITNVDLISQWIDVSHLRLVYERFVGNWEYRAPGQHAGSQSKGDAGFLLAAATIISWLRRMGLA